jgi:O-antigen/teichoic acid export membrane protein
MTASASVRKLVRVSAVLVAARVAGAALTFLTQVVLARWLGAAQLGIFVLAMSLGGVLAICCGLGFSAITPRFVSQYRTDNQPELLLGFIRTSRRSLAVTSLVFVGGTIGALLLFPGLVRPELALPLTIGAAIAPALGVLRLTGSLANVSRRHYLAFLPDVLLRSILLLATVLLLTLLAPTATASLVLLVNFGIVVTVAALQMKLLWREEIVPSGTRPRETDQRLWWRTGLSLVVVILLSSLLVETDVLLLGSLLSPEDIAVFNVCFRLSAFIGFGIYSIHQIMAPDLSDAFARRDRPSAERVISRANLVGVSAGLVALAALAIFGKQVLALVGPEFAHGERSLLFLAAAQVTVAAFGPAAQLLTVGNQQDRCVLALGCGLVALACLNVILVPRYGVEGASFAVLLATVFWSTWLWLAARQHVGFDASILAPVLPVPRKSAQ